MSGNETVREVKLPTARISYRDSGPVDGPPIVFVHGLLVNSTLWRKVVPNLAAAGHRCIAPDLPLGAHSIPVPDADLTPTGVADLISAFLDALDLSDVTLVANDTGAGITQILMSRNHTRVGRVVLATGDNYERFFPPAFAALPWIARIPGSIAPLAALTRIPGSVQRALALGKCAKYPIPADVVDSYGKPVRDRAIRKDLRRLLKGVHKRYTLAAAQTFPQFTKPVLLAWAAEDVHFPISCAERLAADLPNATLRVIDDSYFLVPEDQPELLSDAIVEFTRLHAAT